VAVEPGTKTAGQRDLDPWIFVKFSPLTILEKVK
jgi:hypothetical protein